MFAALGLSFKEKVFSMTGVFLMIFAVIIGSFLFFNSNTILEKFGFETRTSIKAELTKTQGQLTQAQDTNKELVDKIKELERVKKEHEQAIIDYETQKAKDKKTIDDILTKKKENSKKATQNLDNKTQITDTTITVPKQDYDDASRENIRAIHAAFDSLFPESPNHVQ